MNIGNEFLSEDTLVIVRNTSYASNSQSDKSLSLKLNTSTIGQKLAYGQGREVVIKIETKDIGSFNLEIFLYNKNDKIDHDLVCFKVEVYENNEEKELNEGFLNSYPDLHFIDYIKKKYIKQVMLERISNKGIMEIFRIMEASNWNINDAIEELTS